MTRRDKDRRRENRLALLLTIPGAILITVLMVFALIETWQQPTPAQTQQEATAAEPLKIETPDPATTGTIRVFDYDGCCIYGYYGEIVINNDGKDGREIDIICAGYLEGYEQHKDPEIPEP